MSIKKIMMPVDYTGTLTSNRVNGEIHELEGSLNRLLVPYSGFFYLKGMRLYDDKHQLLTRGDDYTCVYANPEVQMRTPGLEVCGAIIIKPHVKTNTASLSCNYVGGQWANYTKAIEEAIAALNLDSREIDFANLVNMPEYFTAGPHVEDIGNAYGFEYLITAINRIKDAMSLNHSAESEQIADLLDGVIVSINQLFDKHTSDSNAHGTTASDVGAYDKTEIDSVINQLNSTIDSLSQAIEEIASSQGGTSGQVSEINQRVNHIHRRLTVVDNTAKNAIRRLAGVASASAASTDYIDSEIAKLAKEFGKYVPLTHIAVGTKYNDVKGKIPKVTDGGIMHICDKLDMHVSGSEADYDVRLTAQFNNDKGGMEVYTSGYVNCIDVFQRSDIRDKELVGELSVERANNIIKHMGPAILYTLMGSTSITAGVSAQKLLEVYPEAVSETVINDEGDTRYVISPGAINALLLTAVFGLLS